MDEGYMQARFGVRVQHFWGVLWSVCDDPFRSPKSLTTEDKVSIGLRRKRKKSELKPSDQVGMPSTRTVLLYKRFWVCTLRPCSIRDKRFRTAYVSHHQTPDDGTHKQSWNVYPWPNNDAGYKPKTFYTRHPRRKPSMENYTISQYAYLSFNILSQTHTSADPETTTQQSLNLKLLPHENQILQLIHPRNRSVTSVTGPPSFKSRWCQ
jgi:hypothetical protein